LTETALAEHTQALAETAALATQQTHSAGEAYALAARARGREEEGRLREEALQRALVQAKEETRLSDRVVGEYAALVRTLEGRSPRVAAFPNNLHMEGNVGHSRDTSTSSVGVATGSGGGSSATLVDPTVAASASPKDGLEGAKAQLAALVESFAEQKAALDARAAALEGERDVAQAQLAAANTLSAELGTALAKAKFEREQARVDDRSAAGMVERYMCVVSPSFRRFGFSCGGRWLRRRFVFLCTCRPCLLPFYSFAVPVISSFPSSLLALHTSSCRH
jgi:hypothetical protein